VPNLCGLLAARSITASFFFSVGPDNMGRHLLRLLRPAFLAKMLRTRAPGLYGWDILFKGTLGPGPLIGERLADVIRAAAAAGHEVGLHAWDHYQWQAHLERMDEGAVEAALKKGVDALTGILGRPPTCSAAPGWKCRDEVLIAKTRFPFRYNSDCRGRGIFRPVVDGRQLAQPQIPVTLPTYDEAVGRNGVRDDNYNAYMLSLLDPEKLNVLAVHAEVEGIARLRLFERFIDGAHAAGWTFGPLGALLDENPVIEQAALSADVVAGREGWVACQSAAPARRRPAVGRDSAYGTCRTANGQDARPAECRRVRPK
jgi:undecaprenyl phosphate-alpha-L-ara4FN deformylase